MNICKRILLLFLLCVVLFAQYSPLHTVYATSNDDYGISTLNLTDEDYDGKSVSIRAQLYVGNKGINVINPNTLFLDNNVSLFGNVSLSGMDYNNYFEFRFCFANVDGSKMFSKGSSLEFSVSNHRNALSVNNGSYAHMSRSAPYEFVIYCKDINGTFQTFTTRNFTFSESDAGTNLNVFIDSLPCHTYEILIAYRYNFINAYGFEYSTIPSSSSVVKFEGGFEDSKILLEETEDNGTKGLLANIIQLVTNIKDGVVNLPSKIASSIKGFFDNVVNAVVNLGTTILEGIKGLFVPSEEDITGMKDKWEQLLADRFGALYQVVDLIADYVEVFQASEQGTITFPSVTIPLGEANFVFGGWEVQVVPEGFDVLFTALKSIISIVCTVWCVNGLKNRFERIVGGSSNI